MVGQMTEGLFYYRYNCLYKSGLEKISDGCTPGCYLKAKNYPLPCSKTESLFPSNGVFISSKQRLCFPQMKSLFFDFRVSVFTPSPLYKENR